MTGDRAIRGLLRPLRAWLPAWPWPRRIGDQDHDTSVLLPPGADVLTGSSRVALMAIAGLVAATTTASLAESYRGLWLWARHHGLAGVWAAAFPLQLDTFIAVGELALFVALARRWPRRSRVLAWLVILAGLAASVAGNVGHLTVADLATRCTAAVPPLAAAAALSVGLGVLKRVAAHRAPAPAGKVRPIVAALVPEVATTARDAAKVAYAASVRGGNPLSLRAIERQFGVSRNEAARVRGEVAAASNGHAPPAELRQDPGTTP